MHTKIPPRDWLRLLLAKIIEEKNYHHHKLSSCAWSYRLVLYRTYKSVLFHMSLLVAFRFIFLIAIFISYSLVLLLHCNLRRLDHFPFLQKPWQITKWYKGNNTHRCCLSYISLCCAFAVRKWNWNEMRKLMVSSISEIFMQILKLSTLREYAYAIVVSDWRRRQTKAIHFTAFSACWYSFHYTNYFLFHLQPSKCQRLQKQWNVLVEMAEQRIKAYSGKHWYSYMENDIFK